MMDGRRGLGLSRGDWRWGLEKVMGCRPRGGGGQRPIFPRGDRYGRFRCGGQGRRYCGSLESVSWFWVRDFGGDKGLTLDSFRI